MGGKHPVPGAGAAEPCQGSMQRAGPGQGTAGAQLPRAAPGKILQLHLWCEQGWQTQSRVTLLMPEGGLGKSTDRSELLGTAET